MPVAFNWHYTEMADECETVSSFCHFSMESFIMVRPNETNNTPQPDSNTVRYHNARREDTVFPLSY